MHVLFIVKAFNDSYDKGSGVFFGEQAKSVSAIGIQTGLIAVNFISWKFILKTRKFDFGLRKFFENGVHAFVYQTPVIPFLKNLNHRRRDKLLKKLSEKYIHKSGKPDLCHVHSFYCGQEAVRLKHELGIPYVITEHYSVFARKMLSRMEIKRAQKTYSESSERIAVSEEFRKLLIEMFHQDFSFLPNIVDVHKFNIAPDLQDRDVFQILSVGNLDRNKNHQLLLNAFARLPFTDCRLKIVGTGPLYDELLQLSRSLGISERTEFAGYVPHHELPAVFHQSDVLVVTSQYETFGLVMIEAMSCGLPVISTPVGVANDIFQDDRLGFIIDYSAESLCSLLVMVRQKVFDKKFIRNFAELNFSSETVSHKLKEIYKRVIDEY